MPIYNVENRFSYYKSYSDNILVGPPRPTLGSSVWDRVVSGSVVSGSEEYKAATFLSDYLLELNNPFFRSGEVRIVRISSNNQQIEDSIVPHILELYTTGTYGSGAIARTNGSFTDELTKGASLLFALDANVITGSTGFVGQRVNNTEWLKSFPFEKKYAYVGKGYQQTVPIGIYSPCYPKGVDPLNDELLWINTASPVVSRTLNYTVYFTTVVQEIKTYYEYAERTGIAGSFPNFSFTSLNEKLTAKAVFGFNLRAISDANSLNLVQGTIVFNSGAYIDGWRYGLYNGVPTNFSCVFRQNHYGQFRDMLEGRPYTQTYNNPAAGGPLDRGITFVSGSALAGESNDWLSASIYAATNVSAAYDVNPYGSGIFDSYYRSSQPWFDNDPRAK